MFLICNNTRLNWVQLVIVCQSLILSFFIFFVQDNNSDSDSDGCSGENSNDFHAYYYFMDCESSSVCFGM